ncbi:alveolysin-like [Macrosteles quadrilineatus]|uniref:alveolysin-like n=1 Tax=Macrosteles quadrilineatus TaxID=74068 RepID=UPI0023E15BBF|nr:alveolysin-like [Macrosteles quadrilineatus]
MASLLIQVLQFYCYRFTATGLLLQVLQVYCGKFTAPGATVLLLHGYCYRFTAAGLLQKVKPLVIKVSLALLFVSVAVAAFCAYSITKGTNNDVDVNNYINGMNYSRDQILDYIGETNLKVPTRIGNKIDGKNNYIVTTREKKSDQSEVYNIGIVSANEHRTYPGSLLLANQRLMDNNPDVLAAARAPLTYTVNLPGLTCDGHFTIEPTFANYQSFKEKTLDTWFDNYSKDHSVVANFQNEYRFAYSREYLRVKFGLEFKNSPVEANIDFSAMQNQEKLIMIHKFKQIYYTVSVAPTEKPSDCFARTVTAAELKNRTNNTDPPVMVDSVSYGRTIYVKLETSSIDKEIKDTLATNGQFLYDLKTESASKIMSKLKDLTMQVFVLGGSPEQIELINARTFSNVNNVIVKYAKFSRNNLGYPISYSANFIKDNSRAAVHMSTEYIETTNTVTTKGILKVVHDGAFIMQWAITWKEVNYDKNGNKVSKNVEWSKNWNSLSAYFSEEIELPGNACDINVFARECTGLIWEWWRTVIDEKGIPLVKERTFTVWGTTLYPRSVISPSV